MDSRFLLSLAVIFTVLLALTALAAPYAALGLFFGASFVTVIVALIGGSR